MDSGDMKKLRRFRFNISNTALSLAVLFISLALPKPSIALPPGARCGFPELRRPCPPHPAKALKPSPPEEIEIGTVESFWIQKITMPGSFYSIDAVCRYIGEKCYIFVEKDRWEDGTVEKEDIARLAEAFERSTPADSSRGIYDLDVEAFGDPSDVDGDPRIYIVVLDILDGYPEQGDGFYAGYFDPKDLLPSEWSNMKEIIYIDCYPLLALHPESAPGTLAHEFQHLIHYARDPDEEIWVNEGCSGYAELLCGYGNYFGDYFLQDPNNSLTDWSGDMADYDQTMMFITYISDHYGGKDTIREIVADRKHGIEGIDSALGRTGAGVGFEDVFSGWTVANYLDGEGIYGYPGHDILRVPGRFTPLRLFSFPTFLRENVEPWAASYVEIMFPDACQIGFEGVNGRYHLLSIRRDNRVGELALEGGNGGSFQVEGGAVAALVIARCERDDPGYPEPHSYELSIDLPMSDVAVNGDGRTLPLSSALRGNFPNPFNISTAVAFDISPDDGGGPFSLSVYSISGRRVRVLARGRSAPGSHTVIWDGKDSSGKEVGSGAYIFVLRTRSGELSHRGVLLR